MSMFPSFVELEMFLYPAVSANWTRINGISFCTRSIFLYILETESRSKSIVIVWEMPWRTNLNVISSGIGWVYGIHGNFHEAFKWLHGDLTYILRWMRFLDDIEDCWCEMMMVGSFKAFFDMVIGWYVGADVGESVGINFWAHLEF